MQRRATSALIALVLAMSGCASGPLDGSVWSERSPLGRTLDTVQPSPNPKHVAVSEPAAEPSGAISLGDALAAALLRSPALEATGYEVRAREAEALQAGLLPNPDLDIEFENFGGTGEVHGFDSMETTLALSQLVELGGKRVKRRRVAEYETRLAGWEYEIRRIDVLSKTAANYVGLLAAERRLRIAIETQELSQRVFDAVGERVDAGKVSPVERIKARVELAQAELERAQTERAVAAARVRLASNWGSTSPQFDSIAGNLDVIVAPPSLESLLAQVEQNPDIARWAAEASLRQAEIELALAQRIPDITVAGGMRYYSEIDETAFVAGLSMPLQIFDRNQGGIRAARLRALQGRRLEEAARVQTRTMVTEAFQILDAAYISVHSTRDEILPSAELAFEAAEEAFRQGKIGALGLLDAERTLFDAHRQLTAALTTYHLAVIASERLIGAPLHPDDQPQGNDQ
ncbi:Heavy metal RND efflux outer membrane protein, CzcC family [hydrothermal vent metagenome]|uniref:Heavy metal RND efflux outer membrane protein, CzcC family n=1 Tax=hydrothermal vent metagenome TaxID=652676 RepID=A0A3B1DE30_9ZZZZ